MSAPINAYWHNEQPIDGVAFTHAALNPAHSVVVRACAGSGKTWLLTARIILLLLEGVEPKQILAITFTKKAAQEMRDRVAQLLREMADVAVECVVSFPNFGHWYHAWSLLTGHMPVSREMPYQWYDTPNLHLATIPDFESFLGSLGLRITGRAWLADGRPVRLLKNLRATQAIYRFSKR